MKTNVLVILLAIVMLVSAGAEAASLTYSPASASLKLTPGGSAAVTMDVTLQLEGDRGTYYLWFVDSVVDGNLPASWITSSRSTAFLSAYSLNVSTVLTVAVPEGTPGGTYSAYVVSKAMKSHSYANPGAGMYISVDVPAQCASAPYIEVAGLAPAILWPPNHDMKTVTVTGTVANPNGCTLAEAGYTVEDEYGEYTGTGTLLVGGDRSFALPIYLEAARDGNDKDGRVYRVMLYGENEAGIGHTDFFTITVPHDMGKR